MSDFGSFPHVHRPILHLHDSIGTLIVCIGQYKQSTYRLNRASEELVYVHEEMTQNQTSIMTINMGISIHYLLISMDSEKPIYALSEK